jgi:alpha-ketoglutarate-dependent taurine dioxygenase
VVTDKKIVEACMPILGDAQKEWDTVFLNAYQIWAILNDKNAPICEQLQESHGDSVGTGAGTPFTPVVRISHALSRSDKIERYYMDARFTKFVIGDKTVEPGYPICDIFRLR